MKDFEEFIYNGVYHVIPCRYNDYEKHCLWKSIKEERLNLTRSDIDILVLMYDLYTENYVICDDGHFKLGPDKLVEKFKATYKVFEGQTYL